MSSTKKPPSKPRRRSPKKADAKLVRKVEELTRERDESLDREAATSDILRMIASSPMDLQSVLDAIAERAARLCDAADAVMWRVDGDVRRRVAHFGPIPISLAHDEGPVIDRRTPPGRAIVDRQTIHVRDLQAAKADFPLARGIAEGTRTVLATPLLREGIAIGAIHIRRREMRPFSDRQIKLLEIFADQAVIAIENARLIHEQQARNRDLAEALEQQTATSEILGVIANSPTDIQPVLDVVAENAARLCEANDAIIARTDNDKFKIVAHYGSVPAPSYGLPIDFGQPITRGSPPGRAVIDRQTIQVDDLATAIETEFADSKDYQERIGTRTVLATPLSREGVPIGVIFIRRTEVRPFTEKQMKLLETFADQAVIAIENVRLFQELKESLEQQTATSEILGVIASSPTDIQPVLDVVAETAARLCDASDAAIIRVEGESLKTVANYGSLSAASDPPFDRASIPARAIIDRQTIHIHDLAVVPEDELRARFARSLRVRTALATPLLREGISIGSILIRRTEVRPFSEKQIALLKTFADQAVIAIENVRLFKELQERNGELREALEHQTATSEVLGIISRSPTDVQPVLDSIVQSAARVCGIDDLGLRLREGNALVSQAHFGPISYGRVEISLDMPQARWLQEHGTLHIPDVSDQNDFQIAKYSGARTFLFVPLRQKGELVGALTARRIEVRPFTPAQIKLLETFADQAVIAIENVRLFNELKESLEQQTATSEILGVIASSPTDLQPVLDVVAENAARLCDAIDARIMRIDGDRFRTAAHFGQIPEPGVEEPRTVISRDRPSGRAVIDRQTIHLHDLAAEVDREYPGVKEYQRRFGARTVLVTPLMREGVPLGVIHIRRTEVRPFSDKQIKLLETFADQAVIAIENVRLFKELQERNAELREALEHQTATAEVLGIISRSPTDVQPVLDAIVASAARVCGIDDVVLRLTEGTILVTRAHFGPVPVRSDEISMDAPQNRWMSEHGTLHIRDGREQNDFPMLGFPAPARTYLLVPLRQQRELIGTVTARRIEVRPFTPVQIKLLETFADQAVIALENVRLFQELKESLEQQTATSEILGVIASSPTDIQPVLDAVAENAARLCDATNAVIFRVDQDLFKPVASYGALPVFERDTVRPLIRGYFAGRAMVDRDVVHIHDTYTPDVQTEFPESAAFAQQAGVRTALATPLIREGVAIGAILIRRMEVRPFSEKQIALLKTFADQAVIAIENVRLFKEIQERNAELREALEHQTATAEVLGIISRSPTDVQPVLDAIVESAARVCGIDDVVLRLHEGNTMVPRAHFGPIPIGRVEISTDDSQFRWMREHGTLHIPDVSEQKDPQIVNISGWRSFLAVPLRQQGELIGGLIARRTEVRPFTPAQIKLLETFADQAVIAIENVRLFQELKESLEQQTATSEILGVIASSPTDIQPVLDTIAENAARVCGSYDAVIRLIEGSILRLAAHYGPVEPGFGVEQLLTRSSASGRAVLDRELIHIEDFMAVVATEFPDAVTARERMGGRTVLAAPLLREGVATGVILIRRTEVRPFTDKQIKLLETFAAQAVIAIENVRLFKELQERNAELREALEHQTATAEVLGIISRSPTDVQPVLDAIVESAARVCGVDDVVLRLREGNVLVSRAHFGPLPVPASRIEISIEEPQYRWMREHGTLHVPDVSKWNDFQVVSAGGWRSRLTAPLYQQGEIVGILNARRNEVRPFTPAQIKLLETFANQAVIAIENVRLFQELKESLEQQTATSEILGVIASSPTDIQPVLDVVAENAARLCGSDDAQIYRVETDLMRKVASYGVIPAARAIGDTRPIARGTVTGRAILDRQIIHVPDMMTERDEDYPEARRIDERMGIRTSLAVPLLREGVAAGAILIRRTEVCPFNDKQIALLKTFADQAVIAIENVRLFNELKESLEQQTATSEILGVIASSPTDIQPVLDAIAQNAARVCGADDATIRLLEGEEMVFAAHFGTIAPPGQGRRRTLGFRSVGNQALVQRRTIHIPDLQAESESFPDSSHMGTGIRTFLVTPLLREGTGMGVMTIRRTEVKPFTDRQVALLETFAAQAVIAIENVRLFKELDERTNELTRSVGELKALGEVGQAVSSTLDLETVLTRIVSHAVQLSDTDGGAIYEYDESSEEFFLRATDQMEEELIAALRASPPRLGDGVVGRAAASREPVQVPNILEERGYAPRMRQLLERFGFRASLAVPLLREDHIIGRSSGKAKIDRGAFAPKLSSF